MNNSLYFTDQGLAGGLVFAYWNNDVKQYLIENGKLLYEEYRIDARIARLPEESFDFLGYTVGRFFGKDGRPYIGTWPAKKSVKSLLRRIHVRTSSQWYPDEPKNTVARISSLLRGWCGYFNQGPVMDIYERVRTYTDRRLRRWLMRRAGKQGAGFRQIPDEYLYETLGLFRIPRRRIDLPRAKV